MNLLTLFIFLPLNSRGIFFGSLLEPFELLLQLFTLLSSLGLFLSLLLFFPQSFTLSQAFKSLLLLKLQVKGSTKLMFVTDPQSVLQLLHVSLLGQSSLMRLFSIDQCRSLLEALLQALTSPLETGLDLLLREFLVRGCA